MSDERGREYLQTVLALDPRVEADTILRRRREFLQPADLITAELADSDEEHDDPRTRLWQRLNNVRRDFWSLTRNELSQSLATLANAPHPETATAAARLQSVAEQRDSIQRLLADPRMHPAFIKAVAEILIAPAAQANRLREREHGWMRPEQNPQFEAARRAMQNSVALIHSQYPEVFKLEEAWFRELLEYNPIDETEHASAKFLFGLVALAMVGGTLFLAVCLVMWIFS